jgi:hypothetical protein
LALAELDDLAVTLAAAPVLGVLTVGAVSQCKLRMFAFIPASAVKVTSTSGPKKTSTDRVHLTVRLSSRMQDDASSSALLTLRKPKPSFLSG